LKPGIYQYKFIVDNLWKHDPKKPKVSDNQGGFNNIIEIFTKKVDSEMSEMSEESEKNFNANDSFTTYSSDDSKKSKTLIVKLPVCHYHYIKPNSDIFVFGSWNGWT